MGTNAQVALPVLVTAFEGGTTFKRSRPTPSSHPPGVWEAELLGELEPDDYYDFQVTRPHIRIDEQRRSITWPTTRFYVARGPERDFVLVHGIEPNMRWRAFCADILEVAEDPGSRARRRLGALLADVPHTRPIPLTGRPLIRADFRSRARSVGIRRANRNRGSPPAHVRCCFKRPPQFLCGPLSPLRLASPRPKAALALITRLGDVTATTVRSGELPDEAAAWQRGVERWPRKDEEIREYVEATRARARQRGPHSNKW